MSGVGEDMAVRSSHSMTTNVYEHLGKLVIDVETLSGPSALIEPLFLVKAIGDRYLR